MLHSILAWMKFTLTSGKNGHIVEGKADPELALNVM